MNGNKLSEIIRTEIGDYSELEVLHIHENSFTGEVLTDIRNLTRLGELEYEVGKLMHICMFFFKQETLLNKIIFNIIFQLIISSTLYG